jgi:hypothetical protein
MSVVECWKLSVAAAMFVETMDIEHWMQFIPELQPQKPKD